MSPDSLQTHYDYMASVELSSDPDMQFILGSALERTMIIGPPSDPSSEHQVDARYGLTLANKDDVVTFSLFLSRPSRDTGIINGQPCQTEAGPMWGFVRRQFSFMDTTL